MIVNASAYFDLKKYTLAKLQKFSVLTWRPNLPKNKK